MTLDPTRHTASIPAERLGAGHALYIPGTGAFLIRDIRPGGPTGRLALLAWDDLALMLRRGTTRQVLLPAGYTPAHPVDQDQTTDTEPCPPALPLAG